MSVSLGPRWQAFVASVVSEGRYASPTAVLEEGLRLVAERAATLDALRHDIRSALDEGGSHDDDDVAAAIEAGLRQS